MRFALDVMAPTVSWHQWIDRVRYGAIGRLDAGYWALLASVAIGLHVAAAGHALPLAAYALPKACLYC